MTLWQISFSGGVMVLVIAVIRVFLKNKLPKRAFVLLWEIVLLRLIILVSVPSVFSVYSLLDRRNPVQDPAAGVEGGLDRVIFRPGMEGFPVDIGGVQEGLGVQGGSSPIAWWMILWLAGVLLCIAFVIVSYAHWYREFRISTPVSNAWVSRWLEKHPLRRSVQIRQSEKISAPLTYGLLHPVILIPKDICRNNREQMECILLHEYIHICRFDTVRKLVAAFVLCIHWFNPMVWLLYVLLNRDIELACDEAVVRRLGEGARAGYARALILLEEQKSGLALIGSHFSKNATEERITAIMKSKKVTIGTITVSAVLLTVLVVLFATSPAAKNGQGSNAPEIQMLYCLGKLYYSCGEDVSEMVAYEASMGEYDSPYIGVIESSVDPSRTPEQELQSNFGYEGSEVIFNGSGIAVNMDGQWVQFLPEGMEPSVSIGFENLVARLWVSISYSDGSFSFTIPESKSDWNILINGRYEADGLGGMSTHFLQEMSESNAWVSGETYSFPVDAPLLTELYMVVSIGEESEVINLMEFLPGSVSPTGSWAVTQPIVRCKILCRKGKLYAQA